MLMRKIAHLVVPVLMVIVIGFVANATLNQHYHILSSGVLITHSHPFEKDNTGKPFQEHHHTTSEFFLLEQMTNFAIWISLLAVLLASCLLTRKKVIFPELINHFKSDNYLPVNYRAPPITSF